MKPQLRRAVWDRCDGVCERCGVAVATNVQHRRARGMGGSTAADTETVQNYAALCGSGTTGCHGWVEGHPTLAADDGWRVPQGHDPLTVPISLHGKYRRFLNAAGGYDRVPGAAA